MPTSSPTAEPAGATAAPARPPLALRPTARLIATALLAGIALLALPAAAPAERPAAGGPTAAAAGADVLPARAAAAPRARLDRHGRALLAELNRVRAAHGRPPLRADARMSRAAAAHARAQARRRALGHGPWQGRVARAAGHPRRVGELLAWRLRAAPAREARVVVRGWLRSPGHRPLLLDPTFRRVGIGRAAAPLAGAPGAIHSVGLASAR